MEYTDNQSHNNKLGGDMTKVWYVLGLSHAAHTLFENGHSSMKLPGTQEIRRMMHFVTQVLRIRYGTFMFITCSFDESHNSPMIK